MICFQSVKWVHGFVYYLCLGLNLKGGGGKREERPVYFRAESHPVKLHSEVQ